MKHNMNAFSHNHTIPLFSLVLQKGEVANRILMVGCYSRAAHLSQLLGPVEGQDEVFQHGSKRQFTTFTGSHYFPRHTLVM